MNWTGIIVGAVSGGIAALAAQLVMRRVGRNIAAVRWVVFIAVFLFASFLARELVVPHVQAATAETTLLKMPLYRALKDYEPEAYAQALATIKANIAGKESEEELIAHARPVIVKVLDKRLPSASEDAVRQMAMVVTDELDQLYALGDASCYAFLFPQQLSPPPLSKILRKETQAADLAALTEVIRSSATAPQAMPTEAQVAPIIDKASAVITAKYSAADLALLVKPAVRQTDQRKVCQITTELFKELLRLPPTEAGKAVKFLMAGK